MKRLKATAVRCGCVTRRAAAAAPMSSEPSSSRLTAEGVISWPRLFGISFDLPSCQTAIRLFVVPRSIPMASDFIALSLCFTVPTGFAVARHGRQQAIGFVRLFGTTVNRGFEHQYSGYHQADDRHGDAHNCG